MAIVVGWSGLNKVARTVLNCAWDPHAMARVSGRETPYGAISVSVSANKGSVPPPAMI